MMRPATRTLAEYAAILLFALVLAALMHMTDAEPGLPRCPAHPTTITRCQP